MSTDSPDRPTHFDTALTAVDPITGEPMTLVEFYARHGANPAIVWPPVRVVDHDADLTPDDR